MKILLYSEKFNEMAILLVGKIVSLETSEDLRDIIERDVIMQANGFINICDWIFVGTL